MKAAPLSFLHCSVKQCRLFRLLTGNANTGTSRINKDIIDVTYRIFYNDKTQTQNDETLMFSSTGVTHRAQS